MDLRVAGTAEVVDKFKLFQQIIDNQKLLGNKLYQAILFTLERYKVEK